MGVVYRIVTELTQLDDYPTALNEHVADLIKPGDHIDVDYDETAATLTISATQLTYERTFVQADLTVNNLLPVIHGLNSYPSSLSVLDGNGKPVIPDDWTNETINTLAVDFKSFAPLIGTFTISIGV